MMVRRLGHLCTHKNALNLQLSYRETFLDKRLAGHVHPDGKDYVTLIGKDVEKIWTPDTFFRNSIESHTSGAIQPNVYARIYPNGKVMVSRRVEMKIACPDIKNQLLSGEEATCPMGIASYGYQATDLEFFINDDDVVLSRSAASFLGHLEEQPIEYKGLTTDRKVTVMTNSGSTYMSVKVNFNLGLGSP